jgi:hypothetical protein
MQILNSSCFSHGGQLDNLNAVLSRAASAADIDIETPAFRDTKRVQTVPVVPKKCILYTRWFQAISHIKHFKQNSNFSFEYELAMHKFIGHYPHDQLGSCWMVWWSE